MSFVNPLFLIGTLAALLPVLIHLLTRDRIVKVEFSTLRFFVKGSQRVLRRKRFQEAILLAMRMLVCALLAIAFARPFFQSKSQAAQSLAGRTVRVIAADVSSSMSRSGTADSLREALQKALSSLSEGSDAAALITFDNSARVEVAPTRQFDEIDSRIDKLAPGHGGTNIPAALKVADDLLKSVQADSKEIVLISDLQRNGWIDSSRAGADDWKLSADVKLTVQSLAPADGVLPHPAIAIVDHYCPESVVMDHTPQRISVKIANRSKDSQTDVPVTLMLTDKALSTQKVNLRGESLMLVQFTHVFDTLGDNLLTIRVGSEEAQTPENTVFFNARVIGRIPVVVLNGAPSANRARDGAFFLNLALSPKDSPPFEVRTVNAADAQPKDIADALVLFLADTDKLPRGMNQALYDLLQRGGGVMFLPGANVSADIFNTQFAGNDSTTDLAPCRLKEVLETQAVPGEVGGISLTKLDFDHPIFQPFAQPHHGDFSTVRFFRWWEVRDYQGATQIAGQPVSEIQRPRVLARFDDGRPALLERRVGRGISMLLASSTDLRWTNFVEKAAVFQPFVHLTAKHLSIRTEQKTAYQVGDLLPVPEGMKISNPQGAAQEVEQNGGIIAKKAGFYRLTDSAGKAAFCYGVNTDRAEVDPATVSADEITAAVQRSTEEAVAQDAIENGGNDERDTKRVWWYLIAALAVLFVMELFVANRTLRH